MKAKAFALNDILPPITGNVFEGIKQVCQHMNRSDKPTSSLAILTLDPHRNSNCQRAQKAVTPVGTTTPWYFTGLFYAATDHLPSRECTLHREKPQAPNDSLSNLTVNSLFRSFLSFLEYPILPALRQPYYQTIWNRSTQAELRRAKRLPGSSFARRLSW